MPSFRERRSDQILGLRSPIGNILARSRQSSPIFAENPIAPNLPKPRLTRSQWDWPANPGFRFFQRGERTKCYVVLFWQSFWLPARFWRAMSRLVVVLAAARPLQFKPRFAWLHPAAAATPPFACVSPAAAPKLRPSAGSKVCWAAKSAPTPGPAVVTKSRWLSPVVVKSKFVAKQPLSEDENTNASGLQSRGVFLCALGQKVAQTNDTDPRYFREITIVG